MGGGSTWDRFTERARRVVWFSQREAARLSSPFIDPGHLLLGLIAEDEAYKKGKTVAVHILDQLGVDLFKVRQTVEAELGEPLSPGYAVDPAATQFTPRGRYVIEIAIQDADFRRKQYVGTEHILVGLLQCEGTAARVLLPLGVSLDCVNAEIEVMERSGQ